ncbi:MAG: hypothetical protein COV44_09285 [Deltaproteobacteria bacterium CG11_big_fil_rev_8_21_14_0_20_45_16]|nr:MAG: hypothetical protein COV44_09285 [Deltaproteobacteria bacterium CG11_big_fil_rev_8_21_14_0_20_45_16]
MPYDFRTTDNWPVKQAYATNANTDEIRLSRWIVIKQTPINRTPLLKSVLADRFPEIEFEYTRFTSKNLAKIFRERASGPFKGVIAELKSFTEDSLKDFDFLYKARENAACILILSPASYSVLNKRRHAALAKCSMLLSEPKSLDYLSHLPRLLEDIGLKTRLRAQNERLRKMVKAPQEVFTERIFDHGLAANSLPPAGLRIIVKEWERIQKHLGHEARKELSSQFVSQICRVVRNSDQVMQYKENEFVIFLTNVSLKQVRECRSRLQECLAKINLRANNKDLNLAFQLSPLTDLIFP